MPSRHDIQGFGLQVMRNPLETQHRPHAEISTRSKLSCLSWNRYLRPHIISSDYEGAHYPVCYSLRTCLVARNGRDWLTESGCASCTQRRACMHVRRRGGAVGRDHGAAAVGV